MVADLLLSLVLYGLGFGFFHHFERGVAPGRRVLRAVLYLGVTLGLSRFAGHRWARGWSLGLMLVGGTFHCGWCLKNGINPLTAEPRDKYERLRGWQ